MISATSSTIPSTVENSWSIPSIRTAVKAVPGIEESKTRRNAFPIVTPNPLSKGCNINLPKVLE